MANSAVEGVTSASRSAGRAMGSAVDGAGGIVSKTAARAREGAEDILAEAKDVAKKDSGRDAAVITGLAATAVLGVVEWPLAAAVGAGYALLKRRRR
jgi:hypothetical protein